MNRVTFCFFASIIIGVKIAEKMTSGRKKNQITEVQFIPIKARNGRIGFSSCVFDNKLYLGGIGIHTRLDGSGLRITYPTKKVGAVNMPLYHPISQKVRLLLEEAITAKVESPVRGCNE